MALINCDECGAEVSSKATACPKCGNPLHAMQPGNLPPPAVAVSNRSSNGRKLGGGAAIFLIAVIAFILYESGSSTGRSQETAPASIRATSPDSAGPTPAAAEPAPAIPQPTSVDSSRLYADYQANEVAADNKYKGRLLAVTGTLGSIKKDFTDDTYLGIVTDNEFMPIHADLRAEYVAQAASLEKGQSITVVCTGNGMIVGSPMLKDCAIAASQRAPTAVQPQVQPQPQSTAEVPQPDQVVVEAPAITASFDCKKAHSTSEMLICGDADLATLDRNLATLYGQAKAAAPDKKAFAEMTRQNWNWRQQNCTDKACLVSWYADQKQRFSNILNPPAQAAQDQGQAVPLTNAAPTSFKTSFDCSSSTYLDEKAICGDPGLAAMDVEMAATYAAAASAGNNEKLASDQRDWLALRRDCASDLNCLRHAYGVRIDQIRRGLG